MNPEEFLHVCMEKGYSPEALAQFKEALALAQEHLENKKRLSGDSYFHHNLHVGLTLVENRTAPEVITAGLLQGLLPKIPEKEIKKKFGEEIISLLKGVEEVKEIKSKNKKLTAESLRKIILATTKDVRIILIKLANKLENLKDIQFLPEEDQQRIAQEVLEIYAPLAYRLGVEKIRIELEDRAFALLHPQEYHQILHFLRESQEQRNQEITTAINQIREVTADIPILKIKGRPKHTYSIYKKMQQRKVKLSELHDLLGIRIIVPEIKDCYNLLGKLHEHFQPVEGRLKDYIANPKPNFYQSIHTGLKFSPGRLVEVQIRTPEMDELNEEGVAAHWRYKKIKSEELFEKKISWLKGILDLQKETKIKEFLETAKVDVFGDEIYCYTPKGDVKELPQGATALDFAYSIHQEVGDHAIGARVNGKFVPLKQELSSGDVIEVLTNKNQRPRRGWLKIVRSGRAKQKIRKALQKYEQLPALHFRMLKPQIAEEQGVLVEAPELAQAVCSLAKCCSALPGEAIVGVVTKRRIISIHKEDCRAALKEQERWVEVQWKNSFSQKIKFYVQAEERSGLLADLLHTIATAGFEVKEAKAKLIDLSHLQCSFLVVPQDLEHLKELVKRVQKVKSVKKIYFE